MRAIAHIVIANVHRLGWALWTFWFASGLMAVLLIALFLPPHLALLVPLVPLAIAAGVILWRKPLFPITLLIASSVLVLRHEDGIQVAEVIYALLYGGFLLWWFLSGILKSGRLVLRSEDLVLILFLAFLPLSLFLTVLFGGDISDAFSQLVALSFFALYFPVRDACRENPHGALVMLGVLLWLALFASVRNVLNYQAILLSAIDTWQVTRARVIMNDGLLMVGAVISLAAVGTVQRWSARVLVVVAHLLCLLALIMTQSRGFWVAYLIGGLILTILLDRNDRLRLISFGSLVIVFGGTVAFLFFGDLVTLVFDGLSDRFGSLGSATSSDLSLINRFLESQAALGMILVNPIIGYGMGVPFSYFDITMDFTRTATFIHNGYISLWYRFGLLGLSAVVYVWFSGIRNGYLAYRERNSRFPTRMAGLVALATLVAYVLPAITSNPFWLIDTTLLFAVLIGVASGSRSRSFEEAEASNAERSAANRLQ
jgi:O-antigen ligase